MRFPHRAHPALCCNCAIRSGERHSIERDDLKWKVFPRLLILEDEIVGAAGSGVEEAPELAGRSRHGNLRMAAGERLAVGAADQRPLDAQNDLPGR